MKDPVLKRLARRVKQLREEQMLSPPELSQHSQVSRSSVFRIENGEMPPNVEILSRLAEALACDELDLLTFPSQSARHDLVDRTRRLSREHLRAMELVAVLSREDLEELVPLLEVKARRVRGER